MKRTVKFISAFCGLLALNTGIAGAMGARPEMMTEYTEASQGTIRFYLQKVILTDSLGHSVLEYSYSLAMDQLQFISQGQSYKAGYTMTVIVYDRDGHQMAGDSWERTISIKEYQQLQKGDSILADTMLLSLPPGEYKARIACQDGNSDRLGWFDDVVSIPPASQHRSVGGARFERDYNGEVIPWPSRIYGNAAGPIVFHMALPFQSRDSLSLKTSLSDLRTQKTVWERNRPIGFDKELRELIPTDSLPDGNYMVNIALKGRGYDTLWQEQYRVVVQNPEMLTKDDFEEKIAQVEYIARKTEFDSLQKAEIGQRETLWKQFWKSRDPTPNTEKNEYRDSYYEKINYANNNFGASLRPGWKTDMGRVYIKYGQPDEIEKHPFDIDSQPYEIWYYYQVGLKIIFLDRHGFGDYRIVYANKEI